MGRAAVGDEACLVDRRRRCVWGLALFPGGIPALRAPSGGTVPCAQRAPNKPWNLGSPRSPSLKTLGLKGAALSLPSLRMSCGSGGRSSLFLSEGSHPLAKQDALQGGLPIGIRTSCQPAGRTHSHPGSH